MLLRISMIRSLLFTAYRIMVLDITRGRQWLTTSLANRVQAITLTTVLVEL